jgi:mannose/fructose/N-acetylgalactosamine-specific phosphotransferase system component IID
MGRTGAPGTVKGRCVYVFLQVLAQETIGGEPANNWFSLLRDRLGSDPARFVWCFVIAAVVAIAIYFSVKGIFGLLLGIIVFVGVFQIVWWIYSFFSRLFGNNTHNEPLFTGVQSIDFGDLVTGASLVGVGIAVVIGYLTLRVLRGTKGINGTTRILATAGVVVVVLTADVIGAAAGWW